jgi:hypothetical protein
VADSIQNRSAMSAWRRQPEINNLIGEREKLQKQLDKILAGPFSEAAEKLANTLYQQIAGLNKKIGSKASRIGKGKAE